MGHIVQMLHAVHQAATRGTRTDRLQVLLSLRVTSASFRRTRLHSMAAGAKSGRIARYSSSLAGKWRESVSTRARRAISSPPVSLWSHILLATSWWQGWRTRLLRPPR
jgi:hypothetical protein